jgi:hypothetical protein
VSNALPMMSVPMLIQPPFLFAKQALELVLPVPTLNAKRKLLLSLYAWQRDIVLHVLLTQNVRQLFLQIQFV